MTNRGRAIEPSGLVVGVVALIATALFSILVLTQVNWDPTVFIGFGRDEAPSRAYGEAALGSVMLRPGDGHDGKFFFIQANDPWVLDPVANASALDRPLYRSQRMLYPVLAGGLGIFEPGVIVWSLLLVNLIAMGAGTWAVSVIAKEMGMSAWWGLAFLLNVGFLSELAIDGAGIVASAAAFIAVALLLRRRFVAGIVLLALAALTREAMLVCAVGIGFWLWRFRGERKNAVAAVVVPIAGVAVWAVYIRARLGWAGDGPQVLEIGVPFGGFARSISGWLSNPSIDLAAGFAVLILLILFTRRVLISRHLVGWAFVGFVGLGIVLTERVWAGYFDITRAVAPVLTSFALLLFAPAPGLDGETPELSPGLASHHEDG
ncbi:MAG: hypothetical protein WBZ40_00295 [Acidimicrobiia bacterium]